PEQDAGVVRGAAAEDPRAELRAVLLGLGGPRVREGELPGVEDVVRPAAALVRAVVGPGLNEADAARGVLGEPRGEDAARSPAAEHDHVEPLHAASLKAPTRRRRPSGRAGFARASVGTDRSGG